MGAKEEINIIIPILKKSSLRARGYNISVGISILFLMMFMTYVVDDGWDFVSEYASTFAGIFFTAIGAGLVLAWLFTRNWLGFKRKI